MQIRLGRNGPLMAVTTRNLWTAKEFFAGASTYAIHVAPGGTLVPGTAIDTGLTRCSGLRSDVCALYMSGRDPRREFWHGDRGSLI
jgi:hypothetical protein